MTTDGSKVKKYIAKLTENNKKRQKKYVSFPKYTIIQHFCKKETKIQTICVKIINKDKVLCIPAPTDRCLGRKKQNKQKTKQWQLQR